MANKKILTLLGIEPQSSSHPVSKWDHKVQIKCKKTSYQYEKVEFRQQKWENKKYILEIK
jgi:hypothetical protein